MQEHELLRKKLIELAEPEYQRFSASLLPGTPHILGVRLPKLRKIAKEIANKDWRAWLRNAHSYYFEEIMLQGMVIGYGKDAQLEERLTYIESFVPLIQNWSVCDSFCSGLKFTKKYPEEIWNFLCPYLQSKEEYEVRFAVVMLLNFYIEEPYLKRIFMELDQISQEGYYAKMAVAWAISICFVQYESATLSYLKDNQLDDFTYHKALQKICESKKVEEDKKIKIRQMKRV